MILALNCGSQSIKWKLFSEGLKKIKDNDVDILSEKNFSAVLLSELEKISGYKKDIKIIGHRFVHNGGKFKDLTVLNKDTLMEMQKINYLAPLHNPYNILGAEVSERVFPDVKQVAVFDTTFFSDIPEMARIYALPKAINEKYGFVRYGFHGISHEYVAKQGAKRIKRPISDLSIITCHLGGGASIAAIKNGKPIDTSMGFTPMEGAVMMTRPGDIDAEIVLKLAEDLGVERARELLNKESGVMGICRSGSMLEVLEKIKRGDKSAKLALDIFVRSIKKYIGAYFVVLGRCDLLIFTGNIGFGSIKVRNMILKDLSILNKAKILAIKTDEELAIADKIKDFKTKM